LELECIGVGGGKLCVTGLYRFGGLIVRNWTVKIRGVNCVEQDCIYLRANCLKLDCIIWEANCLELECVGVGRCKLCGTGLYRFGGLIVWNWKVYIWRANCMELDCVSLGGKLNGTGLYCFGGQIVLNCTV
jgi:hypothetical protein